jgi:hypothetical protein
VALSALAPRRKNVPGVVDLARKLERSCRKCRQSSDRSTSYGLHILADEFLKVQHSGEDLIMELLYSSWISRCRTGHLTLGPFIINLGISVGVVGVLLLVCNESPLATSRMTRHH